MVKDKIKIDTSVEDTTMLVIKADEEIKNIENYKANENILIDKDKKEIKDLIKNGALVVCSKCEYFRYKVYASCPKCGHKEE